jgi:hypothetical protein
MVAEQRETVGLAKGAAVDGVGKRGSKADPRCDDAPTLSSAGIDKHLADSARPPGAAASRRAKGAGGKIQTFECVLGQRAEYARLTAVKRGELAEDSSVAQLAHVTVGPA